MIKDVTGITVCWNTRGLIKRAYNSVRTFYPEIPVIIVDGSDSDNPCGHYVESLRSNKTMVILLRKNIGHGKGMHLGISKVKTKYALIFDSDIEMLRPPIEAMLEIMEKDTFGVGFVERKSFARYGVKATHLFHTGVPFMPYLHPYFQLINVNNYKKYHPYIHHGAPCYLTMLDIYNRGLSEKILKRFFGIHSPVNKGDFGKEAYIRHCPSSGTREYRRSEGLDDITDGWEFK